MRQKLLLLFVWLPVVKLFTQDTTFVHSLDPVTITAGVSPVKISQSGRNVQTISGALFSHLPVQTIDQFLKYIPGVEVQSRGPFGAQSDIVIRGGTFQQVLIIVDGIRINDPLTGHFNSYIPIAPSEIDRVEVLKGAASALYGTEAVGGVIQVITKTYAAKANHAMDASVVGGEYGYRGVQGGGHFRNEKMLVSGGISHHQANGQPQRGTRGFFNNTTASVSVRKNINAHWNVGWRSAFFTNDFSAQNYYTTFASDTAQEKVSGWLHHLHAGYQKEAWRVDVDASYKSGNDRYQYNSGSTANQNQSGQWQGMLVSQYAASATSNWVSGVQWLGKSMESNDRGNHFVRSQALFVIWQKQWGSHFRTEPALRLDHHSVAGTNVVPQFTASWRNKQWQLRGSIGKTLRDADFTERYNNYNKPLVKSGSIGNPALVAESSISSELGADYWLGSHWRFSMSGFNRQHRNLIDFVTTPYLSMPRKDNLVATGTYALAKNISEVTTNGLELDVAYQNKFSESRSLMVSSGLVIQRSKQQGQQEPGFYISSHARLLHNMQAVYQSGKWLLSVSSVYKERQERKASAISAAVSKSYSLINTKLAYSPVAQWQIFIQADNLLNQQYSDILGAPMPRRWLMGGIKWKMP